jgi:hypothetical protein
MKTTNKLQMKPASKIGTGLVFAAILTCLIVAATGSASAANNSILRNTSDQTFEGQCCLSFGESVSYTEPATPVALIVTWSADFAVNVPDAYFAGLSVNGGECQTAFYGARVLPDNPGTGSAYTSASFQWVVLPSDGVLVKGKNTFELCGGGKNSASDSITIGANTLTVAK